MSESKHILVIEDNHDMRVYLREHLEGEGYSVLSAANGRDALNLLRSGIVPNVIILDLNMPIMSGEEFLNEKKSDSLLDGVPVLIISGTNSKEQELGNCYLEKPFNWKSLSSAVSVFSNAP